jgi:hypothetical protein
MTFKNVNQNNKTPLVSALNVQGNENSKINIDVIILKIPKKKKLI